MVINNFLFPPLSENQQRWNNLTTQINKFSESSLSFLRNLTIGMEEGSLQSEDYLKNISMTINTHDDSLLQRWTEAEVYFTNISSTLQSILKPEGEWMVKVW